MVVQRREFLAFDFFLGFAGVLGQRPQARDVAAVLGVVILRQQEILSATGRFDGVDGHHAHSWCRRKSPRPCAHTCSHTALPATMAQGQTQDALGLARLAQDGQRQAVSQAHHVAVL